MSRSPSLNVTRIHQHRSIGRGNQSDSNNTDAGLNGAIVMALSQHIHTVVHMVNECPC